MEEKRHDGRTDPRLHQSPPGLAAVRRLIDGRHHRPGDEAHFRISLPLTDQLRSLALDALVDEYGRSDADKAVAQSFIKMSEVSLTIDCTALPQGTQLTVPEKVIKSAK